LIMYNNNEIENSYYRNLLQKNEFRTVVKNKTIYFKNIFDSRNHKMPKNVSKIMKDTATKLYDKLNM